MALHVEVRKDVHLTHDPYMQVVAVAISKMLVTCKVTQELEMLAIVAEVSRPMQVL